MTTAYKLVDEQHAEFVAEGSFRIGTLSSFGKLEDLKRRDGWEGHVFWSLPDEQVTGKIGLIDFGTGTGNFTDCAMVMSIQDMYCLCLTLERDNGAMLENPQAQFRIADVAALAQRLTDENPRLGQTWGCKPVTYEERLMQGARNQAAQPDPFIKSPWFAHEQEYRIVWPDADRARQPDGTFDLTVFNTAPSKAISRLVERC